LCGLEPSVTVGDGPFLYSVVIVAIKSSERRQKPGKMTFIAAGYLGEAIKSQRFLGKQGLNGAVFEIKP
jgi:hypothetical protein